MPRRGLREKIVYGHNPLPNVSELDLLERAGLDLEPATVSPFRVTYQIGNGMDYEFITLDPGESVPLRESEAAMFLKRLAELGIVVVEDPDDEEEMKAATKRGLTAARRFYGERGANILRSIRHERGISRDEMEDMKDQAPDYAYHLNQAKADLMSERLKELRASRTAKGRKAPAKE